MDIFEYGPGLVSVCDRVIPVWNIQVDGYPKMEKCVEVEHFFPIFFECPFETGDLWVVTYYGDKPIKCHEMCYWDDFELVAHNGQIRVEMYDRWVDGFENPAVKVDMVKYYVSWQEFHDAYSKFVSVDTTRGAVYA